MKLFIEKKWLLVTVAATLLLSGCSSVEQSIQEIIDTSVETLNTKKTEQQPIPAKFIRHVDGDTTVLRIDGKEQKVRFLLVDTPETVKPKTKVQPYGLEASKRTKELLSTASEIFFEYDKGDRVDRYRRALGALVNTAIGTTIRNVHVVNSSIESLSEKPQVGGIVGTGESINIFDSSVQSSKVSGAYVGGIIGRSLGSTIVNVYTTGEVLNSKDGDLRIGGIIGSGISRSFLKNAYTTVAMECFMAMWFMLKRLELTGESYHCHRFIYKSNV